MRMYNEAQNFVLTVALAGVALAFVLVSVFVK